MRILIFLIRTEDLVRVREIIITHSKQRAVASHWVFLLLNVPIKCDPIGGEQNILKGGRLHKYAPPLMSLFGNSIIKKFRKVRRKE